MLSRGLPVLAAALPRCATAMTGRDAPARVAEKQCRRQGALAQVNPTLGAAWTLVSSHSLCPQGGIGSVWLHDMGQVTKRPLSVRQLQMNITGCENTGARRRPRAARIGAAMLC